MYKSMTLDLHGMTDIYYVDWLEKPEEMYQLSMKWSLKTSLIGYGTFDKVDFQ